MAKGKMTWEKALKKAFQERARELDILREHDLKAKASRPTASS